MKNSFTVPVASLLIATIGMFAISTCEEESVIEPEEPGPDAIVIGSIHGIVKNATTGARLSGVTVTWVGGDTSLSVQTTTTDDMGYYIINSLNPGTYSLSFTGPAGFTEATGTAFIPSPIDVVAIGDQDPYGVYYVNENLDASLYALTGGFKGLIWAPRDDGTSKVASGATVQFTVSSSIAPSVYNTTSGDDGAFALTGLPAGAFGTFYVLPYTDGDVAYATNLVQSTMLTSGEVKNLGEIYLSLATDNPFVVSDNYTGVTDFDVTNIITATFSKAMDTASFEVSIKECCWPLAYEDGALTVTWTNDITITIAPAYPFDAQTTYQVELEGDSQDGNDFYSGNSFTTQKGIVLENTNLWLAVGVNVGDFPVDSDITLTFSEAVDLDHYATTLTLYDQFFNSLDADISASADGKVVTLDPVADLNYGEGHTVQGNVYSTIPGDLVFVNEGFRTAEAAADPPTQVTGVVNDTTAYVWPIDWNNTGFHFEWDRVAGATAYNIYAKDTYQNTEYVKVVFGTADMDQNVTQGVYFGLLSQFDYFEDDGMQTPFSHGTQVSFIIKAVNAADDEGPASAALTFSDKQAPYYQLYQWDSVNNTGGTVAKEAKVYLGSGYAFGDGEYLSTTLTLLKLQGPKTSAGGGATAAMEWDNDRRGGIVILTVAADSSVVGDSLIIHFKDTSGNTTTDTVFSLY